MAALVTTAGACSTTDGTRSAKAAGTAESATPWQLPAGASLIAVARRNSVTVTGDRDPQRVWRLSNPRSTGAPLVFLVLRRTPDRYVVRVPARPNGSTGWVRAADVELQLVEYSLRASLRQHRLTLFRLGSRVRDMPIGVGSADAPTPTGQFFLTELLQPPHSTGPYGAYAYGLSAFSHVYSEFEGGPGQIGMHGTNDPSSIGRDVSHGCIRLRPRDIDMLAHVVPAGAPITISA